LKEFKFDNNKNAPNDTFWEQVKRQEPNEKISEGKTAPTSQQNNNSIAKDPNELNAIVIDNQYNIKNPREGENNKTNYLNLFGFLGFNTSPVDDDDSLELEPHETISNTHN